MNLSGLVTAEVDLGFLVRAQIALRNPDLRPAWKVAKPILLADQREHAKKQEGPSGPWPALASSTKARRAGGRRTRARRMLGRLATANKTIMERRRMIMRSPIRWSGAHAEGDTVGRGARLPARPMRWASGGATEKIAGVVARGIAYLLEGA